MMVLIPVTLECVPQSNKDGVVQYNGKMKVVVMVMEEMKQAFYNDQNQCTASLMTLLNRIDRCMKVMTGDDLIYLPNTALSTP